MFNDVQRNDACHPGHDNDDHIVLHPLARNQRKWLWSQRDRFQRLERQPGLMQRQDAGWERQEAGGRLGAAGGRLYSISFYIPILTANPLLVRRSKRHTSYFQSYPVLCTYRVTVSRRAADAPPLSHHWAATEPPLNRRWAAERTLFSSLQLCLSNMTWPVIDQQKKENIRLAPASGAEYTHRPLPSTIVRCRVHMHGRCRSLYGRFRVPWPVHSARQRAHMYMFISVGRPWSKSFLKRHGQMHTPYKQRPYVKTKK